MSLKKLKTIRRVNEIDRQNFGMTNNEGRETSERMAAQSDFMLSFQAAIKNVKTIGIDKAREKWFKPSTTITPIERSNQQLTPLRSHNNATT